MGGPTLSLRAAGWSSDLQDVSGILLVLLCFGPSTGNRRYPSGFELSSERLAAVEVRSMKVQPGQSLLTPAEVAAMFRVDPKTVTRWANAGKLTTIRTLGGHRRFLDDEVRKLLVHAVN
jgi:excisionase family DNA binding protein